MTLHPKAIRKPKNMSHLNVAPEKRARLMMRCQINLVINGAERIFLLRNIKSTRAVLTSPLKRDRRRTKMCKWYTKFSGGPLKKIKLAFNKRARFKMR